MLSVEATTTMPSLPAAAAPVVVFLPAGMPATGAPEQTFAWPTTGRAASASSYLPPTDITTNRTGRPKGPPHPRTT